MRWSVETDRVNLGGLFDFIVKNNILIIEILLALILVTITVLAYRSFFAKAKAELGGAEGGASISAIEASLKKILESTEVKSSAPAVVPAELESLKANLTDREMEIEALKAQLKSAQAAGADSASSSEEALQWQNKTKELEAKLAEYEIISEDIADLSMYKEENAKLKKELEALKAGGAPLVPHVAVAEPAPPPSAPVEPAIVAAADPVADIGGGVDDDIMAEFARAVEEQKAAGSAPPGLTPEPGPSQVAAEAPSAEGPIVDIDTMLAEESAPEPPPLESSEPAAVDLGEMNLEAMVAEADGLASAEVAEVDSNILEASLNTEKLAEEALTFQKVKDEDEQLMDQFEDFMKKGAS